MMLSDRTHAKVGDVVWSEPPRGAAVVDRDGYRWMRVDLMYRLVISERPDDSSGGAWLSAAGEVLDWAQLGERSSPLRLSL